MFYNAKFSLRQTWVAMIMFATIVPVAAVIAWYGPQLYDVQLNSALAVERQSNILLRNKMESEVRRLKTLLHNKSDPLSLLVLQGADANALKDINALLGLITQRESSITAVLLVSSEKKVIATIDASFAALDGDTVPSDGLQDAARHWGFNADYEVLELVIPLLGRSYVSSPIIHQHAQKNRAIGDIFFHMAVPVGEPAIAVLIAEVNVDALWRLRSDHLGSMEKSAWDYMLDRRGSLLTSLTGSDHQPGDLLTHLEITRQALIRGAWPISKTYQGVMGRLVYGTLTEVPSMNWTLISEVDASSITDPILRSLFNIILVTLLGVIIFIGLVVYLAGKTLKPIQATCDAFDRVAKGDLQLTLAPSIIQELNALASGFNKMTTARLAVEKNLKNSQATLANSEAKFRGVLESAVDGVLMVDKNGIITLANQALCDMCGYAINELIGTTVEKLVPVSFSHHTQLREAYFQNPSTRRMGVGRLLSAMRKDGTHFPVEVALTPVDTDEGVVVAAIIQDITERTQKEREKEALLSTLAEKNAELERFTYTVSHDLKSPLVTISGFIGLLKKDIDSGNMDKVEADFIRISEAASTMQHLLDDLLELSRIGQLVSTRVDIAIADIVTDVRELLDAKISDSQAKITVEADLPIIHVEEARFKEVYLNLIENAIKYQRDDIVPVISIGAVRDPKGSEEVVFFVKDNGLGIDARYQKKIFGLFERLSNDSEGTGIGLAIVKRIIEVHGGRIWVESDGQGQGTTFKFVIAQNETKQAGDHDG